MEDILTFICFSFAQIFFVCLIIKEIKECFREQESRLRTIIEGSAATNKRKPAHKIKRCTVRGRKVPPKSRKTSSPVRYSSSSKKELLSASMEKLLVKIGFQSLIDNYLSDKHFSLSESTMNNSQEGNFSFNDLKEEHASYDYTESNIKDAKNRKDLPVQSSQALVTSDCYGNDTAMEGTRGEGRCFPVADLSHGNGETSENGLENESVVTEKGFSVPDVSHGKEESLEDGLENESVVTDKENNGCEKTPDVKCKCTCLENGSVVTEKENNGCEKTPDVKCKSTRKVNELTYQECNTLDPELRNIYEDLPVCYFLLAFLIDNGHVPGTKRDLESFRYPRCHIVGENVITKILTTVPNLLVNEFLKVAEKNHRNDIRDLLKSYGGKQLREIPVLVLLELGNVLGLSAFKDGKLCEMVLENLSIDKEDITLVLSSSSGYEHRTCSDRMLHLLNSRAPKLTVQHLYDASKELNFNALAMKLMEIMDGLHDERKTYKGSVAVPLAISSNHSEGVTYAMS